MAAALHYPMAHLVPNGGDVFGGLLVVFLRSEPAVQGGDIGDAIEHFGLQGIRPHLMDPFPSEIDEGLEALPIDRGQHESQRTAEGFAGARKNDFFGAGEIGLTRTGTRTKSAAARHSSINSRSVGLASAITKS